MGNHPEEYSEVKAFTENELVYLEDHHMTLARYDVSKSGKGFVSRETGENLSAKKLAEKCSETKWGLGMNRDASQEFSEPKKLLALMKKVKRYPEFAALYSDENRTTNELPRAKQATPAVKPNNVMSTSQKTEGR